MEDRAGGSEAGPSFGYSKDQILALCPPLHHQKSDRNGNNNSASSSQVLNYLSRSSLSSPNDLLPISARGQFLSLWPPGLAAWVEEQIFPVLLPQQVMTYIGSDLQFSLYSHMVIDLPIYVCFQVLTAGKGDYEDQSVDAGEVRQESRKYQDGGVEGGHLPRGENNEAWEEETRKDLEESVDNTDPGIFEERLEALVDNMEPSEKEMRDKDAVLESLKRILSNKYPEVELMPYGSSESSLAFPGSDLDIFVWLGDEEEV